MQWSLLGLTVADLYSTTGDRMWDYIYNIIQQYTTKIHPETEM